MLKNQKSDYWIRVRNCLSVIVFIASCLAIQFFYYFLCRPASYSFFIEFSNASGIKVGTPIRMRGVYVGSIQDIRLKLDCVLVMAKINSSKILVSSYSMVETTQTGLLNETVIDIIPYGCMRLTASDFAHAHNPLSISCDSSTIVCNRMYISGDRGLNYDDLIRSATRISQRFDDPRVFNLFYLLLQNSIDATDILTDFISLTSTLFSINYFNAFNFLYNNFYSQL